MKTEMKTEINGVAVIAKEREEQISKHNWSVQHDIDMNQQGELAQAAMAYLANVVTVEVDSASGPVAVDSCTLWPKNWYMSRLRLNPNDRIKDLAKAGALIAAEIDRLLQTTKDIDFAELYKYAKHQDLVSTIQKVREEQIQRGLTKENLTNGRYTDAVIAYCANEDERILDELAWKYWPFKGLPEPEDVIEDRRSYILNAIALLVAELEDLEE